ncbi:MAG: GTPase HflX [Clostridia bacterium]
MLDNAQVKNTRAVLIKVITGGMTEYDNDICLDELSRLLDTAGGEEALRVTQLRNSPDVRTYVGKGKAEEIAQAIKNDGNIELAIVDDELTPSQIKNLENVLDIRVIDRTMLILDIFALHAVTSEGKLQVEIACLRYTSPRLIGKGKDMSRLGGGIGTRGPGESKLESDRRHLKRNIAALELQLDEIEKSRGIQRSARQKSKIKTVAIVGYTNAGKSTLLNYLTGAGILVEDKLFATLDPTTRRLTLSDGKEILLTDTVGFIDRLPTHLVKAFKSTLEELKYADIIINLTDSSECDSEKCRKHAVTETLIRELGAADKPILEVYNKSDLERDSILVPQDAIKISAKSGAGVDIMLQKLTDIVNDGKKKVKLFFNHENNGELSKIHTVATVLNTEYNENGTLVYIECEEKVLNKYKQFVFEH